MYMDFNDFKYNRVTINSQSINTDTTHRFVNIEGIHTHCNSILDENKRNIMIA